MQHTLKQQTKYFEKVDFLSIITKTGIPRVPPQRKVGGWIYERVYSTSFIDIAAMSFKSTAILLLLSSTIFMLTRLL